MLNPRLLLGLLMGACCVAVTLAAPPEWTLYRPTNTGIPGDYTQALYVSPQDQVYVAAYLPFWEEGGMGVMDLEDPHKWRAISNVDHPAITSPRFNDIEGAPDGTLWIASDGGLLHYDPAVGPASLVRYDSSNSPMPTSQVFDVAIEPGPAGSHPAVWLAIYDVRLGYGGLARLDPVANTWQVWRRPDPAGYAHVDHVGIMPDAQGSDFSVWFSPAFQGMGMVRNGVISPAPTSGNITPIDFTSTKGADNLGYAWLWTTQGIARRAPDNTYTLVNNPAGLSTEISVVYPLRDGRAVLGTYYSDVFVWDGSWTWLGAWGSSHTYAFAEDSQGRIWAGGIGGAARYENGRWQRYRETNQSMIGFWIQAIDFAPTGEVYMNGNAGPGVGGFNIFDGVHWTSANDANAGIGPQWGLPTDDVKDLVVRANGHVALALNGVQGIVDYDGSSYAYLIPQGWDIIHIAEDTLGRIWGGAYNDGGVWLVSGTRESPVRTNFLRTNSPLPGGENAAITVDRVNAGWVYLTMPAFIVHTNGEQWETTPRENLGLRENSIGYFLNDMKVAADGTWWIATGRGLYHYDPVTRQYTVFNAANAGLAANNITFVEIAPDASIWCASYSYDYPYPGSLSHLENGVWTHSRQGSSPLPHNQIWELTSRAVPGGYEVWVGTASEGIAVVKVETAPVCGTADFDGDSDVGTDRDIEAFFACLAGSCCNTCFGLGADFDADGDVGTDRDIEAFFRVLAGNPC